MTIELDVDLSVEDQGRGLIEETPEEVLLASSNLSSFESHFPKLMRTKQERIDISRATYDTYKNDVVQIYSQSNTSACVGFASAQALEITSTRRYGIKNHHSLSGMSVYKNIGRTIKSGAMISDGMKQIANVGALPLKTPENDRDFELTWGLLDWSKRFPSGWKEKVPYRVSKWATATGEDEIESALASGFVGIVGRDWHCIPYYNLKYDGSLGIISYANSWGTRWGDNGVGYDSRRKYRNLTMYVILEVIVPEIVSIPNLS